MQKKITFVELIIKLKTTWCKKISLQMQNYPRFVLDTFDSKEQLIEGNFKERNVDHSTKVKHVGK